MIQFSPSYLFTTLVWGLGLSNALPKGQKTNNHGITKGDNSLSNFTIPSALVQDPSVTSKYSKEQIKAILEAALPAHSDYVIRKLKSDAGYPYTEDIEHETPVNEADLVNEDDLVNGADLVDEEDLKYLFKEPEANNPDTVHHRSARAAKEKFKIVEYVDLPNENCVSLVLKTYLYRIAQLYYHCFQEPCKEQENTVSGAWLNEWVAKKHLCLISAYSETEIVRVEQESVVIKPAFRLYVHYTKNKEIKKYMRHSSDSELNVPCPSEAYQHVLTGNKLFDAKEYPQALDAYNKALETRPKYPPALYAIKELEKLAKTTRGV
ncbi:MULTISPECIES: hypothetical protein [unclassified Candidatus Tisiphia]|uniref:hypothetical protein n=1 Tax=unclassified Candidatus Tisiphia TaxID=2996318 RepID=UPI00312CB66E